MTRMRLALATGLLISLLLPCTSTAYSSYIWMDYYENQDHVYGTYVVNGTQFKNYYAGPWQSWADNNGVRGAYQGLLFCVEASVPEPGGGGLHRHGFDLYYTDDYNPPNGNVAGMKWAAYLLHNVLPTLGEGNAERNRSALQLAIWEAIYDGSTSYAFNLRGGPGFYVVNSLGYYGGGGFIGAGFTSNDVINRAAYYLTTYRGLGRAEWLHDGQDQLRDIPGIPEPGTLLLLGGALLGPAVLTLRRRRRS